LDLTGFANCYPILFGKEGVIENVSKVAVHFKRIDVDDDGWISWPDMIASLCIDYTKEYVPRAIEKLLEKEFKKLDPKNRGWCSQRQFEKVFKTPDWTLVTTDAKEEEEQNGNEWEVVQEKRAPSQKVSQPEFMQFGIKTFAVVEYTERIETDDLDSMMISYFISIPEADLVHKIENPSNPPVSPKTPQTPRFPPGEHKRLTRDKPEEPIKGDQGSNVVKHDKSTLTEAVATLKPLNNSKDSIQKSDLSEMKEQKSNVQLSTSVSAASASINAAAQPQKMTGGEKKEGRSENGKKSVTQASVQTTTTLVATSSTTPNTTPTKEQNEAELNGNKKVTVCSCAVL
jgi:hypothetical protein